jgi:hypothetical protein
MSAEFHFLTAATMYNAIDVSEQRTASIFRAENLSQARNSEYCTANDLEINLMFLGSCMVCYSTLKMEAVYSF